MKNQHGKPNCHHTSNVASCDANCSQCKRECMHANSTHTKKESQSHHREDKGYEKKEHPKKWNS